MLCVQPAFEGKKPARSCMQPHLKRSAVEALPDTPMRCAPVRSALAISCSRC